MIKEYKDWLFVEVPEDAEKFVLDMGYLIFKVLDRSDWVTDAAIEKDIARFLMTGKSRFSNAKMPEYLTGGVPIPGSWQIIGKGDAVDWDGIVDKEELFINGVSQGMKYKDYKTEDVSEWFNRCKDSKKSLLRSLGMEPGTTLVLKKQTK